MLCKFEIMCDCASMRVRYGIEGQLHIINTCVYHMPTPETSNVAVFIGWLSSAKTPLADTMNAS